MKTHLPILLLALAVTGCKPGPKPPRHANTYTVVTDTSGSHRFTVEVINVFGHEYVVAQGNGLTMLHAGHCPCLSATNKVQLVSP